MIGTAVIVPIDLDQKSLVIYDGRNHLKTGEFAK